MFFQKKPVCIIIIGPTNAGKTTLSIHLEKYNLKSLHFDHYLNKSDKSKIKYGKGLLDHLLSVQDQICLEIVKHCSDGENIVYEGSHLIFHSALIRCVDFLKQNNIGFFFIILDLPFPVLLKRLLHRITFQPLLRYKAEMCFLFLFTYFYFRFRKKIILRQTTNNYVIIKSERDLSKLTTVHGICTFIFEI